MAIAFDAVSDTNAGSSTSASWTHTCGSGEDRIAIIDIHQRDTDYNTANMVVTYGGASATLIGSTTDLSQDHQVWQWYYLAPPVGASTVVARWDNATSTKAACRTFFNVYQGGTPYSISVTSSGGDSDAPSLDVTTVAGEMVVDAVSSYNSVSTAGAGQDTDYAYGQQPAIMGSHETATGPTTTMSWGAVNYWTQIATSLKQAVASLDRSITYFFDIYDPRQQILDAWGRPVPPWEIRADRWIKVTGNFLPDGKRYDSFVDDPELAYIESVTYTPQGGLRIKTSRAELGEVLMARAAGRNTL